MWDELHRESVCSSWDHRIVWIGRKLKITEFQLPAMIRDDFHNLRLLQAPFNLALNASRNGAPTASLGNLCQGLTPSQERSFS